MKKVLKENIGGVLLLVAFIGMFAFYMHSVKVNTERELNNGVITYEAK